MLPTNCVPVMHEIRSFVLAGKSLFTVANMATGKHFTFKVEAPDEQAKPQDPVVFVKVLDGPDNYRDYQMMGMLFSGKNYVHWNKSKFNRDCPSEVAFVWLMARLIKGDLPDCVKVFHHGYCGRCGHLLTEPDSIQRGLGPVCASKGLGF